MKLLESEKRQTDQQEVRNAMSVKGRVCKKTKAVTRRAGLEDQGLVRLLGLNNCRFPSGFDDQIQAFPCSRVLSYSPL